MYTVTSPTINYVFFCYFMGTSPDGHSDDGFYSAFTGVVDPEDSQCEKNNLSTLLIFNCNGRQFWDPADPLSLTVAGILRNPLDPCQVYR